MTDQSDPLHLQLFSQQRLPVLDSPPKEFFLAPVISSKAHVNLGRYISTMVNSSTLILT